MTTSLRCNFLFVFSYQGFLHRHWRFTGQQGKGGDHLLFHSTTFTRSRTLRHLFATLHVIWLPLIFNHNACGYQTATRWDLPPYRINVWLNDWWCNVCLFTWRIDIRFLLQRFDIGDRWIWTRIDYHPCINELTKCGISNIVALHSDSWITQMCLWCLVKFKLFSGHGDNYYDCFCINILEILIPRIPFISH